MRSLRNCKKSPSAGGMSRKQVDDLAREYGIDPSKFKRKDDLCDEIARIAQERGAPMIPVTPAVARPAVIPTAVIPTAVVPAVAPPTVVAPPPTGPVTNIEIAQKLRDLGTRFESEGETYRARAFLNAARTIERFPVAITDPATQLRNTPGIGGGVIDRIQEYLNTGKLTELEEPIPVAETEKGKAIEELTGVYGIGPATATKLYDQGIKSVKELVDAYNDGKVDLTANQIIGLTYYDHFKERIPRDEVKAVGDAILAINKSLDPDNIGEIVGSYRRGQPTSGDIDIIISNKNNKNYLPEIVQALQEQGFLENIFALGAVSLHGTYWSLFPEKNGILRKIDIRFVPIESYPTALLHATGSDQFNIMLRRKALEKGMTLSEYGLFDVKTGARIPTASEEDIFKALGTPYVPPEERNL